MLRFALALLLGFIGLAILPGQGEATVRELLMRRAGLNPVVLDGSPSVRLIGLGQATLSVLDEANELNALDFGGNIAGVLADSDRWVIDAWMGNYRQQYERSLFESERRFGHGGCQVVQRSASRALGLEVNWGYFQSNDRDGDWRKIRGPLISAIANQRIGPVTLGMIIGQESENEDLLTTDFFGLKHSQRRWIGQLGALADLAGLQVGAGWDFELGDVVGTGEDPTRYHEDTFAWSCPRNRYSFLVLLPRRGNLEGGVRVGYLDRSGYELVSVSWSDDSPQNPSQTDYFAEAVTFSEEETDLGATTRWRIHCCRGTILGLEAGYHQGELDVQEGVNFKGSQRAGYWKDNTLFAGVGVSRMFFNDRLLSVLEARGSMQDWESEEVNSEPLEGSARYLSAGGGCEYFVGDGVFVRAAYWVGSQDKNLDEPLTLSLERSVSGGISWLPRGGLVQLHAAVRFERRFPLEEAASALEESEVISYSVAARFLP